MFLTLWFVDWKQPLRAWHTRSHHHPCAHLGMTRTKIFLRAPFPQTKQAHANARVWSSATLDLHMALSPCVCRSMRLLTYACLRERTWLWLPLTKLSTAATGASRHLHTCSCDAPSCPVYPCAHAPVCRCIGLAQICIPMVPALGTFLVLAYEANGDIDFVTVKLASGASHIPHAQSVFSLPFQLAVRER